jgi:hypothetical protein
MEKSTSTNQNSPNETLKGLVQKVETWDVSLLLNRLPAWMAYAEEQHAYLNRSYLNAKLEHKKKMMTLTLSSRKKTATERKIDAELDAVDKEALVIEAMTKRDIAEVKYNYLTNKFISARKQTNLMEKQITPKI